MYELKKSTFETPRRDLLNVFLCVCVCYFRKLYARKCDNRGISKAFVVPPKKKEEKRSLKNKADW